MKKQMLAMLRDLSRRVRNGEIDAVAAVGIPAAGCEGVVIACGDASQDEWDEVMDDLQAALDRDDTPDITGPGDERAN